MLEQGNKLALSKLKLLYIFNQFGIPLTNIELTNFVLENNFMEYFILQQILSDLCASKFIDIHSNNGHEYYFLTDEGINSITMFEDMLPEYFVKEVSSKFEKLQKDLKRRNELFGHYYRKSDNEYVVSFQVLENRSVTFNLSINVPTENMAKSICEKWNSNPEKIFNDILNTLTSGL